MPKPLRPWASKLVVTLMLALPVAMFFALQAATFYTRSGSLEEVWFVEGPQGPALLARDQIVVGTEKSASLRNRLSLVDLRSGERLVREKVDDALAFLGQDAKGFWFQRRVLGGDLHLRNLADLSRMEGAAPEAPSKAIVTTPLPTGSLGTLTIPDAGRFPAGEWVLDASGKPLRMASPDSVVAIYKDTSPQGGHLLVSRVAVDDGRILWTAKLERQRGLRAARQLEGELVLVTSGAARDFAVALEVATGKTRWVYFF